MAGATLGAAVPSDDYWPAIREVCTRHDVRLIADEVITVYLNERTQTGGGTGTLSITLQP